MKASQVPKLKVLRVSVGSWCFGIVSLLGLIGGPVWGANSLQVSGAQQQIVGTNATVTGSGDSSNFGSASVNDFAVFDVQLTDGTDYADLVVRYVADNGGIGSNLMIAQTVDSQGLTDSGTVSVLFNVANSGGGTIDLQFDWYMPDSFVGGEEQLNASFLTSPINYTTFDIDFKQVVEIQASDMRQYTLDGSTVLNAAGSTAVRFEDSGANSTFNDPTTAASFLSRPGQQSHLISAGKQDEDGNALFMFEFRDPSQVVTFTNPQTTIAIPEITSSLFISAFLTFPLLARRRSRS